MLKTKFVDEDLSQLDKSKDECKETVNSTRDSNDDDAIDLKRAILDYDSSEDDTLDTFS